MIAPSKSGYRVNHPDHVIVFNANVCTPTRGVIWNGDLDITVDSEALKAMAAEHGEELYIFRESDGYAPNPVWDANAAVARITADTVTVHGAQPDRMTMTLLEVLEYVAQRDLLSERGHEALEQERAKAADRK
jgi:hypothetical protein